MFFHHRRLFMHLPQPTWAVVCVQMLNRDTDAFFVSMAMAVDPNRQ